MVVPTYQDGKTDEYFNMNNEQLDETLVDTRKAGKVLCTLKINSQ